MHAQLRHRLNLLDRFIVRFLAQESDTKAFLDSFTKEILYAVTAVLEAREQIGEEESRQSKVRDRVTAIESCIDQLETQLALAS